MNITGNELQYE